MTKESLEKAREIIIFALMESNIDIVDRTELIINEDKFLNPFEYEDNVKTLIKKQQNNNKKVL